MSGETRPVVVVGGGLAGLTAAATLARSAGVRVEVFEAADHLGGRCGTPEQTGFEHAGRDWTFPVEHGVHGIWVPYRNVRSLLADHGLTHHLRTVPTQELVILEGDRPRWLEIGASSRESRLPNPLNVLALLSDPAVRRECFGRHRGAFVRASREIGHVFAFDPSRDGDRYDQHTVADLITGWPPTLEHLFSALTHSAFFRPPRDASLAAFAAGLQLYVVRHKVDNGFDVLTDTPDRCVLGPLADTVRAAGGEVTKGARVVRVEPAAEVGRGATVLVADGASDQPRRVEARAVVLAVDPPGMAGLTDLVPPRAIPAGVPSASVRLWFSRAPSVRRAQSGVFSGTPMDNFFWLHALQRPFEAWGADVGGSVLECHLYAERADESLGADDATITARTVRVAERVWPRVRGSLVHAHVRRNPPNHPALAPGLLRSLPSVETARPDVTLCGDWVATPWPCFYMERSVATARLAARGLARHLGLDLARFPEALPPRPASLGFRVAHRLGVGARRLGLLPPLSRQSAGADTA